jgi:DNA-binding CsgD family transcriptional regulator
MGLVERRDELASIAEAVAGAAAGAGCSLLIEGSPGVGKTCLADLAASRAADAGMLVLRAAGAALEQDLSWGVVRSALGPQFADPADAERLLQGAAAAAAPLFTSAAPPSEGDRIGAVLHGLYWLLSDLAGERPVALIIDDAHWADAPSARWLAHLAARVGELPLLLVLAARPAPPAAWWQAVAASPSAIVSSLAPLSLEGTRALVADRLGDVPDAVADACHQATGGNPFLLGELLRHVGPQGGAQWPPEHILALRPDSIRRSVLLRLGELGPPAIMLCFAIAVLGQAATLPLAAELAGLDEGAAEAAATALENADVIAGAPRLQFVHPLVLDVVDREIPAVRRAALHLMAAELLERRGAPPSVRAPHLLATEPDGRPAVVRTLRAAADGALSMGAPEIAVACLRRALSEPPPADEEIGVLLELGRAEGMLADPAGVEHLWAALGRCTEPVRRGLIARELAIQLLGRGELDESVSLCHQVAAELPDSERELRYGLLAHARTAASQDLHSPPRDPPGIVADQVNGTTPGERMLLAAIANVRTRRSTASMMEACELAERALQGTALLDDVGADSPQFWNATMVMMFGEDYARAEELVAAAVRDSRRRGSPRGYGLCLTFGSPLHFRLGRLREAAEDAQRAAEMFVSEPLVRTHALSFMIEALIDLGELDAARAVVARGAFSESTSLASFTRMRGCIARLRRLEGDAAGAAADLLEVGREHADVSPVFFPWRAEAALAFHAAGDGDRARGFAAEEAARGERVGSRWVQARALHALGVVDGSVQALQQAEELTRNWPTRLERARVLVELGAALRRRGHLGDAATPLREGLDLADRCGAAPLAARARDELAATGARPRRARISGPDALTPSELRVCRMAAEGATNREIAQALFVSLRTVETHLTRSYLKLGIGGRDGLVEALTEREAAG